MKAIRIVALLAALLLVPQGARADATIYGAPVPDTVISACLSRTGKQVFTAAGQCLGLGKGGACMPMPASMEGQLKILTTMRAVASFLSACHNSSQELPLFYHLLQMATTCRLCRTSGWAAPSSW